MRPRLAWPVALLATLALAGCSSPAGETSSTTAAASDGQPVEVAGTLVHRDGLHLADLTARNVGSRVLTVTRIHCLAPPWTAEMVGPAGEPVRFKASGPTVGCPSMEEAMPPGTWKNWTADPQQCRSPEECSNVWDGRLWEGDTPKPAPPGTYTWTFRFPYQTDRAGTAGPAEGRREASLAFTIEVG